MEFFIDIHSIPFLLVVLFSDSFFFHIGIRCLLAVEVETAAFI